MRFDEKQEIMDKLEYLALKNQLSQTQKQHFLEKITNWKIGTDLQRERYILHYGLDISKEKKYTYAELSRLNNCTAANIKGSVLGMRRAILRLDLKEFQELLETVGFKF